MFSLDITERPRRNRKSQAVRLLNRETYLTSSDLICPFFITDGSSIKTEIKGLPNVFIWSLDLLFKEIEKLLENKVFSIMLFPHIPSSLKDPFGSFACNPQNIIYKAISKIKNLFPEINLIIDLALDPYTDHGHDGLIDEKSFVLNDETVRLLGEMAFLYAELGADCIAPSDMMDGRISFIRQKLDQKYSNVSLMSYAIKHASSFYSPFRNALNSHLLKGDKKNYQLPIENTREAIREAIIDEKEGADILIIKPALTNLDLISKVKERVLLPLSAYQVSGEYSMILAAVNQGWLDKDKCFLETLLSIKRSGADMIISYATPFISSLIKDFDFY